MLFRYYFVINDNCANNWPHKYLTCKAKSGPNNNHIWSTVSYRALLESDKVIIIDDSMERYYKNRYSPHNVDIDPDELTLIKLSSVDIDIDS